MRPAWSALLMTCGIPIAVAAQGGDAPGSATLTGAFDVLAGRAVGVVVFLTPLTRSGAGSIASSAPMAARVDQRGLQFLPPAIAVTPGSTVSFPNSDPVLHNIFLVDERLVRTDLGTFPSGEMRVVTLDTAGAYLVMCHLHPEMVASVFVVDAPYRAVTDSGGRFRIDGIAAGTYRLSTWHRQRGMR